MCYFQEVYTFIQSSKLLNCNNESYLRHPYLRRMSEYPPCPKCKSIYTYESSGLLTCPECFHEWNADENDVQIDLTNELQVLDSNGQILNNGDTVMVIKDLPVRGAAKPVKAGTKVKNIKLSDGDHNISCKIEGFGAMGLKSEFVKKVI